MKRIVLAFLLTILLPAILLAGFALRSLRDQELVVDSQRTRLHQSACDGLADRIDLFLNDLRDFHGQLVDELVAEDARRAETDFDGWIRSRWSQAAAAAVVREGRTILSPQAQAGSREAEFLGNHADFLTNRRVVEIYQAPRMLGGRIESEEAAPVELKTEVPPAPALAEAAPPAKWKVGVGEQRRSSMQAAAAAPAPATASRSDAEGMDRRFRNVTPTQQRSLAEVGADGLGISEGERQDLSRSALAPESVGAGEVTSQETEGAVSRIIDGRLHVLLWKRHPLDPKITFWTELDLEKVRADLTGLFSGPQEGGASGEVSYALLDSDGGLVSQTVPGFSTDWTSPYVASEIGPLLPHWEVAAYLLDPDSLDSSAKRVRFTLWTVILALLAAVVAGGALILRSVGDEMRLASQKTDFVGNVSHELKTPLTSIRMFSELLSGTETPDPKKTRDYAEIIARESARLTRLINRLLDFSKLDRGEMRLDRVPIDLGSLAREVAGGMREPFEAAGMALEVTVPEDGGPRVAGDRDAFAQVVVNLLGNALKYAASGGSAELVVEPGPEAARLSVLDRGPGIPRACQRRIFDKFYRVDDSITATVDGSGIGLALCRQIAEQLGGTVRHEARRGGGSVFTLELPLLP